MMNLQYRRPDGSFVATLNGYPYHVTESDPLFDEAVAAADKLGDALPFEPPPPEPEPVVFTRLSKAEMWRRMTGEETAAVYTALAAVTPADPVQFRLRMIFESAQYLDTRDPDYPELRAGVEAALGLVRANIVLEPDH